MLESPFFSPEEIITGLLATDVDRVLKAGSLVLAKAAGLPSEEILKAVRESEKLGSTANSAGVAIPHAFLRKLPEPLKLLILLRDPVIFNHDINVPVDVVIMLIWPTSRQNGFLPALARHSRIFRDPELLARLRAARDVTDVIVALGDHSRGTPTVRSGQGLSLR
ncbi:Nitrogen regulatory protein [Ensifer adhaerens]|nr:Nitrogen regulatory protein [Ensifer adhaerens]